MAFPSSSGTMPMTLEAGWSKARDLAASIKAQASATATAAAAGSVSANAILALTSFFSDCNIQFTAIAAISGMAAYAQTQVGSSTLNVAAAFSAMQTQLVATVNWIMTNFPKDASSNLLYTQFTADGHLQYTKFTAAQLATFVTQLNSLVATID